DADPDPLVALLDRLTGYPGPTRRLLRAEARLQARCVVSQVVAFDQGSHANLRYSSATTTTTRSCGRMST
ncbi:hypothetical protein, partial [Streptomyces gobitricini]|uniref:hypothetical protein n=1 Tax=Streptomyces gobitricini TaxID=68211 RepID=UPI0031D5985F